MTKPDATPPVDDPIDEPLDDAAQDGPDAEGEDAAPPEPTPLEAAQGRVAELEDRLRRTEAEFVNETKRIRKNAEAQGRFAIERVVTDLLPVVDALHSAYGNTKDDAHREGLELVERQLMDALKRHGIERIHSAGEPFDPGFHEAMLVVEDPTQPDQTVSQEMRAGFTLNGRVVRPAQVMVTKNPAASASDDASEDAGDTDEVSA